MEAIIITTNIIIAYVRLCSPGIWKHFVRLFIGGTKVGLGEELTKEEGVGHRLGPKTTSTFQIGELTLSTAGADSHFLGQPQQVLILQRILNQKKGKNPLKFCSLRNLGPDKKERNRKCLVRKLAMTTIANQSWMAIVCQAGWGITTVLSGRHYCYYFTDEKTELREVKYLVQHYTAINYRAKLKLRTVRLYRPHS